MSKVFQVVSNGFPAGIRADFEAAIAEMAAYADLPNPGFYSEGQIGSVAHQLRFEYEARGCETVQVVEHDMSAPHSHTTVVRAFEFVSSFDPSYAVQHGIYTLRDDEDVSFEEVADEVHERVRDHIEDRMSEWPEGSEDVVLEELRNVEALMKGPKVIPDKGDAETILAGLPLLARNQFVAFAREEFPDEGPALA